MEWSCLCNRMPSGDLQSGGNSPLTLHFDNKLELHSLYPPRMSFRYPLHRRESIGTRWPWESVGSLLSKKFMNLSSLRHFKMAWYLCIKSHVETKGTVRFLTIMTADYCVFYSIWHLLVIFSN
jgi:hypothetical protein